MSIERSSRLSNVVIDYGLDMPITMLSNKCLNIC